MDKDEQKQMIDTETTNLQKYWQARDTAMAENRNIINLLKPEAKTGSQIWTTNEPKVFFDTSRSLISINPPRFRLPIQTNYTPEQKDQMNKAERLCIGIYRSLNDRQAEFGGVNWLWDLAYWILLGWYSVFSVVKKDKEGQIKFVADIFDPMTVYPQWDSDGLVRCIRTYQVDKVTAMAMAESYWEEGLEFDFNEPTSDAGRSTIINYWHRTFKKGKPVIENAIMVAGNLVKSLTVQRKLTRIPIHIGAIGSPDRITTEWMNRKGESIIDANKDSYDYLNTMIRLMAQILAENAYPNRVWKLLNPHAGAPGEMKGYGEDIFIKPQEAVELIKSSTTPNEANILVQYFGSQVQKGSIPNVVYGGTPIELSGFAISQLMAAIKYKLGMYLNAMQMVTSRVFSDFLYQYKTGKYGKITLSTENPYDLKRGMAYMEEFESKDVPENIYVEVTIPISSQFDKTQAIMNSVQALQSGLLSRETLWEEELDIQDSEQEKERIREDQVSNDPFVRQMEILEAMWRKVEMYKLQGDTIRANALSQYIMQLEMQMGMRQGIPQKAGVGVSPNIMPPEARPTPQPTPDQMRSFTQTPPPSPTRPTTETQAGQNQGRKGILVSPTGKVLM